MEKPDNYKASKLRTINWINECHLRGKLLTGVILMVLEEYGGWMTASEVRVKITSKYCESIATDDRVIARKRPAENEEEGYVWDPTPQSVSRALRDELEKNKLVECDTPKENSRGNRADSIRFRISR
jgi:hypothetical protein